MKIVIATVKSWNVENALKLQSSLKNNSEVMIIEKKEDLTYDSLVSFSPDYVFFRIGLI